MSNLATQLDAPTPNNLDQLGGDWDIALLESCQAFSELSDEAKLAIRDQIDLRRTWVILGWAERTATLSVRTRDRRKIVLGLVALSLFDHRDFDVRDALVVLPLFVRAAQLIHVSADATVRDAAAAADPVGRKWLLDLVPVEAYAVHSGHTEIGLECLHFLDPLAM